MDHSMKDVCTEVGLSYETLKFYCNAGLIPNVRRDEQNHRIFDDRMVGWIKGLMCLRHCDMGIREMKEFLDLGLKGKASIPERKVILTNKKALLEEKIQALQDTLAYIDRKLAFYDDVMEGRADYVSNLVLEDEADAESDGQ